MKNSYFLCAIFLLMNSLSMSQTSPNEKPKFRFGFGLGIGIFYPKDVSDYIEFDLTYKHGAYDTWNTELYMNYVGSVSLTFSPTNMLDLIGTLEYGWGPKFVTGVDEYYHFDRISPGVLCNFNIPLSSGRHSIFFGCGVLLHSMSFEDFKATTVGPRIQIGFNFQFGRLNPQVCISYDYIVSESESTVYYSSDYYPYASYSYNQKIKLNYSGILCNLKLNF